jgi:hypothetical protein
MKVSCSIAIILYAATTVRAFAPAPLVQSRYVCTAELFLYSLLVGIPGSTLPSGYQLPRVFNPSSPTDSYDFLRQLSFIGNMIAKVCFTKSGPVRVPVVNQNATIPPPPPPPLARSLQI